MENTLDLTFAALADPTRRAMLARLARGAASISDLGRPFLKKMSRPAITKHVQVLEKAGLIAKTRQAQWRPCALRPEALRPVDDWMEQYRTLWEEQFDRLDVYLKTVTAKQKPTLKRKNDDNKR